MIFDWDPIKNKANLKKHGIAFEEAVFVFKDIKALSLFDGIYSMKEERWITMGMIPKTKILVVVHTYKVFNSKELIRIISARKATKKESEQYFTSF